jgi:hypothetical protein
VTTAATAATVADLSSPTGPTCVVVVGTKASCYAGGLRQYHQKIHSTHPAAHDEQFQTRLIDALAAYTGIALD